MTDISANWRKLYSGPAFQSELVIFMENLPQGFVENTSVNFHGTSLRHILYHTTVKFQPSSSIFTSLMCSFNTKLGFN